MGNAGAGRPEQGGSPFSAVASGRTGSGAVYSSCASRLLMVVCIRWQNELYQAMTSDLERVERLARAPRIPRPCTPFLAVQIGAQVRNLVLVCLQLV